MYGGTLSRICNIVSTRIRTTNTVQGYSPAKLKTECPALSITLASKLLGESTTGTCRVRIMWWLLWWQAGTKISTRDGVFLCQTENRAPHTQYQSDIKTAGGVHGGDP